MLIAIFYKTCDWWIESDILMEIVSSAWETRESGLQPFLFYYYNLLITCPVGTLLSHDTIKISVSSRTIQKLYVSLLRNSAGNMYYVVNYKLFLSSIPAKTYCWWIRPIYAPCWDLKSRIYKTDSNTFMLHVQKRPTVDIGL